MTAPKPLPPCPIYGEQPNVYPLVFSKWWLVSCVEDNGKVSHDLSVGASTQEKACAVWRRLAGGRA